MTKDEMRLWLRTTELAMTANDVEPQKVREVMRWLIYGPPAPINPDATVDLPELPDDAIMLTPADFLDYVEHTHGAQISLAGEAPAGATGSADPAGAPSEAPR